MIITSICGTSHYTTHVTAADVATATDSCTTGSSGSAYMTALSA
jgi:hypothetical protein